MSKQSTAHSSLDRELSDGWMDHPFIDWLIANKQVILWALIGLFATLLISYRYLSARSLHAESDFMQAEIVFQQIEQGTDPSATTSRLQELATFMSRYPELQAKYDGSLAQILLIQGRVAEAKAFAQSTFKRVRPDQLAPYEEYAKTSLLIAEGLYTEALQHTLQLQAQLKEKPETASTTLPLYNLVRLAFLYQQLGQKQEESAAWDALLKQTEDQIETVLTVNQLFQAGHTSLGYYITERKKALESAAK